MAISLLPDNVYEVRQHELGLVSRKGANRRDTLMTAGINPCIGVLLWNSTWVALGHIDKSHDGHYQSSYAKVIQKMRDTDKVVYARLAFAEHYRGIGKPDADHRYRVKLFLLQNGVCVGDDIVGGDEDGMMNIAISRAKSPEPPEYEKDFAYRRPSKITRTGSLADVNDVKIQNFDSHVIALVLGENTVKTYRGAEDLASDAIAYGL